MRTCLGLLLLAALVRGDDVVLTPAVAESARDAVLPTLEAALGPFKGLVRIEVNGPSYFAGEARAWLAAPDGAALPDAWERLLRTTGCIRDDAWGADARVAYWARSHYDRREKVIHLRSDVGVFRWGESTLFLEGAVRGTVLHELVHALRDQQGRYGEDPRGSDARWAARALREGDAAFFERALLNARPETVESWLRQTAWSSTLEYCAPRFGDELDAYLDGDRCCYAEGALFIAAVYQERGLEGIARVFADPPVSSEEILHPERYLHPREEDRVVVEGIDLGAALGGEWRCATATDLGEIGIRLLLQEGLGFERARHVADGWRGCGFVLYEAPGGTVLALCSRWDDEHEAVEFATGWCDCAGRRDGGESYTARVDLFDTGERRTLEKGGRRITTVRRGADVAVVECPADLDPGPLLAAVWNTARVTEGTRGRTRPRPAAGRRDRPGGR